MALLVTSSTGYREIAPILEGSVDKGKQTTRRFRGQYDELLTLSNSLGGIVQRLEQEDDIWWLLSATFAGWPDSAGETPTYPSLDSQIVTLWSLQGSRIAKSIWELPSVRTALESLRDKGGKYMNTFGVAALKSDLTALARGEVYKVSEREDAQHGEPATPRTTWLTWKGLLASMQGSFDTTVLTELFSSLCMGVENYAVDAFVLRMRSVAPSGANLAPVFENTNRAHATASILGYSSIPTIIQSRLPSGYWMKGAPVVDQTDASRFEVVQDWTWTEKFDQFVYGVPL